MRLSNVVVPSSWSSVSRVASGGLASQSPSSTPWASSEFQPAVFSDPLGRRDRVTFDFLREGRLVQHDGLAGRHVDRQHDRVGDGRDAGVDDVAGEVAAIGSRRL